MFVEFFSDYTRTNIGFVARWTALPYWQECGGHLSGNFGIVTLPVADFPNHNRNRAICAWIITVEPGKVIRLTFSAFNVTREYRCCFDWLIIFDSSQTEMQRHCEPSIPEPFLSQGNKVYLWFYFNWCLTVAGFRAEWEAAASFSQDLQ
ncbi:hypothetical protein EGW08_019137 [Elysia chlorotica]|uniref:CUB domain-containing protein n=1 Tax=Elysia chlorotica TaxID=188477 RepID=A0A3S1B0H3_ELYCH|nr:hypothetical protein EGW08_019137 [Elysia chlorotica]